MAGSYDNGDSVVSGEDSRSDELLALTVLHPVGLAQHTDDRDPIHTDVRHEPDGPIEGCQIEIAFVVKGCYEDGEYTLKGYRSHRQVLLLCGLRGGGNPVPIGPGSRGCIVGSFAVPGHFG